METFAADLRSYVTGLLSGISGTIIILLIRHYWTRQTIKSMKRRLEQAEAYKAGIEYMTKSDRAVLLHGFITLLAFFGVLSCTIVVSILYFFMREDGAILPPPAFLLSLIWLVVAVFCFAIARCFKQVSEYPESIKALNRKISEIRRKLARRSPDEPR